jgi:hypothetical protein
VVTSPEHEEEIARLQDRLGDLLAHLRTVPPATAEFSSAADSVIEAAYELIDYEERVPELLDVQPRWLSGVILRSCGVATMVLAASIALRVVPGGMAWWWLPVAIVLAVAGARLLTARVRRVQAEHRYQRQPAVMILVAALLAALGTFGAVTGWFLGAAALLLIAAAVLGLRTPNSRTAAEVAGDATGEAAGDAAGSEPGEASGRSGWEAARQNAPLPGED